MRGAIFDLDGTIADSARDLIGSVNDLLVPRGIGPIGLEDARAAAGMGGRALIRHAFMREGWDEETAMSQAEALYPAFLAIYECRIAQETRLLRHAVMRATPCGENNEGVAGRWGQETLGLHPRLWPPTGHTAMPEGSGSVCIPGSSRQRATLPCQKGSGSAGGSHMVGYLRARP